MCLHRTSNPAVKVQSKNNIKPKEVKFKFTSTPWEKIFFANTEFTAVCNYQSVSILIAITEIVCTTSSPRPTPTTQHQAPAAVFSASPRGRRAQDPNFLHWTEENHHVWSGDGSPLARSHLSIWIAFVDFMSLIAEPRTTLATNCTRL